MTSSAPGIIEVILLQDQLGEYDNGEIMCADYNVAEWVCDLNILNAGHSLQLAPDETFQFEISGVINDCLLILPTVPLHPVIQM